MAPALVLHIFSHSGSNAAEKIKVALEPIRESLRCGLSLPHPAAEYYAAFGEATMAAEALFFAPDARLMQYSPARRNEELERQWIRELSASLLKPNDDGISAAFARLAEYCRESFLGKEDLERALLLVVDEQMAGCVRYFSNERVSANHHLHYIRLIKEAPSLRRMLETMLAFGASLRRISGIEGSPLHENYRLYIQNNLNTVTLNAMAKEFNYNPTYFSKHFSGVFGQSFKDYLLDARLEKAKELLEKTDLKIYEITERVGFKAPAHFIKVFREQLSLSPKQYRIALDKRRRDCGEGDDPSASSGREPPPNHP